MKDSTFHNATIGFPNVHHTSKRFRVLFASAVILFILIYAISLFFGQWYMKSGLCFRYLGCNAGFFGYDGVAHFISGIVTMLVLVWWWKFSVLEKSSRKLFIKFMIVFLCVGLAWELIEFSHDHILNTFAYFEEIAFLQPFGVAQPSQIDTIGDLILSSIGGIATFVLARRTYRKSAGF